MTPCRATLSVHNVAPLKHRERSQPEFMPFFAVGELSRGDDEALLVRNFSLAEARLPILLEEADLAEGGLALRPAEAGVAAHAVVAVEPLAVGEEQGQRPFMLRRDLPELMQEVIVAGKQNGFNRSGSAIRDVALSAQ